METLLITGLGLYLSTTMLSIILQKASVAYIYKRLDEDGYYDKSKELSLLEKIKEGFSTILTLLTPIKNLYLTTIIYSNLDQTYEDVLEDGLEDGTIVRKEDLSNNKIENINLNAKNNDKTNSKMSNKEIKESLEQEKAFLLSLNQKEETKSYNDKTSLKK